MLIEIFEQELNELSLKNQLFLTWQAKHLSQLKYNKLQICVQLLLNFNSISEILFSCHATGRCFQFPLFQISSMNCFVTVVTGANKGIGLACCKALARGYGWHALGFSKAVVVMASRDLSKLQMAKEEVTQNALSQIEVDIVEMNVSDDQSVLHAAKQIENKRKRVDLLINNAGICVLDSTGTLGLAFSEQVCSLHSLL